MTKKIFYSIIAAAISVCFVTFALIMGVLYSYFSDIQKSQLRTQLELAAQGIETLGMDYFTDLAIGNYRITWVAADGSVLYDNVSNPQEMENHLKREEIQKAVNTGYGESVRYSSTLTERLIYSAKLLEDGTILRMSMAQSTVFLLLLGMLKPLAYIIIVAAFLAFFLAKRLSKRIVQPINNLDLDDPLENEGFDELSPLFRRIDHQQKMLQEQKNALQRQQNELATIIDHMEEGMLLLDSFGCILSINEAAKSLLIAPGDEPLGSSLLLVNRNLDLNEAVKKALDGEIIHSKTAIKGKIIQISAAPIHDETGKISGTALVLFDVTVKEQAEQTRREFTANVSHELKTPLHAISGYSELLKCGMVKTEDVVPFAEKIYTEVQRLIQLVEDIINLSHLDEGATSLNWEDVNLYMTAKAVIRDLTPVAEENQITMNFTGSAVSIKGIYKLIYSIIYNLCDNAIKYNRPGGDVTITVAETPNAIALTVRDNGIGIPEEHLPRIFERFYRVDKSHSKAVGGTGLGLSIVKHAVKIHHARIEIESKIDEGTAITILFPKGN